MNAPDTNDLGCWMYWECWFSFLFIIIIIFCCCFLWLICASIHSLYTSVLITGCRDCEANNNNKNKAKHRTYEKITKCCMVLAYDPVRWWYTKYVYEYKNQFGWRTWRICHNFIRKQWKKRMTPFSAYDDWKCSWTRKSIWLQLKINTTQFTTKQWNKTNDNISYGCFITVFCYVWAR